MNSNHERSKHEKYPSEDQANYGGDERTYSDAAAYRNDSNHRRCNVAPNLSEEERAVRLHEMEENAELHEEQRWKRLKMAEEDDKREAILDGVSIGKNFLDAAQKSVYGAEKGGSSTMEERVKRRAYYSQGREASERNAFRR